MTCRQLYQLVSDARAEARGDDEFLDACVAAMRLLRELSVSDTPRLSRRLLDDARFGQVLRQDDALGLIHQALNAPRLEAAYRSAKRDRRKFEPHEIPAVTQLFTPRWVVEFLLQNTLGRLWRDMHPDSRIPLPWLVEAPPSGGPVARRAADIRLLDPACGTMNFGLVAADLLDAMYGEELARAGAPGWPAEPSVRDVGSIASAIARRNLHGIDIDPWALRLASLSMEMKLRCALPPGHLRCADALFDPGVQHRFTGACDVVATNPPYLSARNLARHLVERLKQHFPAAWRDAGACFLQRCLQFARDDGGRVGLLAMQSFMFVGSFEALRGALQKSAAIEAVAHFGPGLFPVGNPGTLQTAAIVLRRETDARRREEQSVACYRLGRDEDKRSGLARDLARPIRVRQLELASMPRGAWTYWLSSEMRRLFSGATRLADVAPPRQGLATTDNARFVRYWWEVMPCTSGAPAAPTPGRWFPYAKSGRFRRWYEAPRHRVDWQDDGRAIKQSILERYPYLGGKWAWVAKNSAWYGRGGVTYSYLTSGQFSARRLEQGTIFDVAGSSLFPEDPLTMLAVLNSSVARELLSAINPTVNFQVGDLAQLPLPSGASDGHLRGLVGRAIELQRRLDTFDETTPDFVRPLDWDSAAECWFGLDRQLREAERDIDLAVSAMYGLRHDPSTEAQTPPFDRADLARRWASFAIGRALGRWSASATHGCVVAAPCDGTFIHQIRHELADAASPRAAEQIEATLGGLDGFVSDAFYPWHCRLYRYRPVIWMLARGARRFALLHDRATAETIASILRDLRGTLPGGWDRYIDDGIAVNLSPLAQWISAPDMRKRLARVAEDLKNGRLVWSQTHARCTAVGGSKRRPVSRASTRGSG